MQPFRYIESRRELFVDDWLIERMDGVRLVLHAPVEREVAVGPDPGGFSYATVLNDDDRCRMYYRTADKTEGTELTAYAESPDGITWTRPNLGIVPAPASGAPREPDNIVWDGQSVPRGCHNFAPFKDTNPDAPDSARYKALAGCPLHALGSPDGLNWHLLHDEPVITEPNFDSQNIAFWDEQRGMYVAYKRIKTRGVRGIARCVSTDFVHWSKQEHIDTGDAPDEQLYTNAAVPYFRAPHIYIAFPRRFVTERRSLVPDWPHGAISDSIFMSSRDGLHWDRRFMEAFWRQGPDVQNWTDRNGTIAWGIVPTTEHELSLYRTEHNRLPTCCVRRGTLRTDGFVSVHADYRGGEMVTRPLVFGQRPNEAVKSLQSLEPLSRLVLNYATSAVGGVQVEIQDVEGRPLEGFELCEPIYGDQIDGTVHWSGAHDVSRLTGTPIRLRFVLRDADLYALQFQP